MKLIHLGDLHLGKTLGEYRLIEDQRYMLRQIIGLAEKINAEGIILAGDIYDRADPGEEAVSIFDEFLTSISSKGIKIFAISGNHDSEERLNFGSSIFSSRDIHIAGRYDGKVKRIELEDKYGKVDIYLLPFVKASKVRQYYPDAEIKTYDDAVRCVVEGLDIDSSRRNVMVAHQFVIGNEAPVLGGSEGPSVKHVGNVEYVGYSCFDAFDYVALGHIHSPQSIGREEVRYSGSLLKYSLSEVDSRKAVTVLTLEEKGKVGIELVEIKPLRDLRHIKGKMDVLLRNVEDEEDFIYVTLTDEDVRDNAMTVFQQYYPNTVKIDYDNEHVREIEGFDIEDMREEGLSFEEVISSFYAQIFGSEIPEEEMKILKETAGKAGVYHEAG